MDIGIIGGGSIGLLAAGLLSSNHNVLIYVRRTEQAELLNTYGLCVKMLDGKERLFPVRAVPIHELSKADLLLVCVKQPELPGVLHEISQLDRQLPLVFLQNGMGHLELIEDLENPVFVGITSHGAIRTDDHHVSHTGLGLTQVGAFNTAALSRSELLRKLRTELFPAAYVADWRTALKEKLVVNAVINPLTAVYGVLNGAILENERLCLMAQALCREAAGILRLDPEASWRRIQEVAGLTKGNRSSMLQDIEGGRATEADAILGFLLQGGEKNNYLRFMYESIKILEEKREIPKQP